MFSARVGTQTQINWPQKTKNYIFHTPWHETFSVWEHSCIVTKRKALWFSAFSRKDQWALSYLKVNDWRLNDWSENLTSLSFSCLSCKYWGKDSCMARVGAYMWKTSFRKSTNRAIILPSLHPRIQCSINNDYVLISLAAIIKHHRLNSLYTIEVPVSRVWKLEVRDHD